MSQKRLQRTQAQKTKRATVEPKSAEAVELVRRQMRDEGLSELVIKEALENVEVLSEEEEAFLN